LPGRGSNKIETSVNDQINEAVKDRAKALNMSVAAYLLSLISKDVKANKVEVLFKTAS